MHKRLLGVICIALFLAACGGDNNPDDDAEAQVFQATLPAAEENAPVYTATATSTETLSPTPSTTFTPTLSPTLTLSPTITPSETPTLTLTPTPTLSPTPTLTPTVTPTLPPSPTTELLTLTAPIPMGAPVAFTHPPAEITEPEGWSCGDFPCEDDIAGFLQRIRVPLGYAVSHVGQFPGQPMQITYGPDERLYATVLEDIDRNGAVYAFNADGSTERYSETLISPIGLAFQPGTDTLYVSARLTPQDGGGIWQVLPDGRTTNVLDTLPCCFSIIDNQPNSLTFGPDGWLYIGVGALTDHAEPQNPDRERIATFHPWEASILRIHPHRGEVEVFAQGIRNPYDITFDSDGQFYVTDNGILTGPGDRLLKVNAGGHYGWPYWRLRGCEDCPLTDRSIDIQPDLLGFPAYTLPRGLVAYTGQQFPVNIFDSVFVTLWHNTPNAQRVVRIDPDTIPTDPELRAEYVPEPFVTGLIRPVDVVMAPDGALVVADFIYGHVWKVTYTGEIEPTATLLPTVTHTPSPTETIETTPTDAVTTQSPTPEQLETQEQSNSIFVTSTPRP